MFDLRAIQQALQDQQLDGWLLYDFRGLNVLARRIVALPEDSMLTRRWFYFIPASGEPRKLVHRIEPHALDVVPGPARTYLRWPLASALVVLREPAQKVVNLFSGGLR